MNTLLDSKRNNWLWSVTLLSLVLGMLLAAALKTQQTVKQASGISTTRVSGLTQLILDEKDRNKKLQEEIGTLRSKVDKYEKVMGEGGSQSGLLKDELEKSKLFSGLLPAQGFGVEVDLHDSTKKVVLPADTESDVRLAIMQEYIVHDQDLRTFVNELLANGAEAVSISDRDSSQRVVATTPIRCDSGVIRVNRVPMASPFTITAIGPPNVMKTALEMQNGLISNFRLIDGLTKSMVRVSTSKNLIVPAYSGATTFKYASISEAGRNQ